MTQRMLELLAPPSSAEFANLFFVLAGIGSLVAVSEYVRKRFRWSAEVTRKLVHISVGVLIFFAPELFHSAVIPLALGLLGVIAMAIAVWKGLLTGMHGTTRASYGTIFYPIAFLLLIILFWNRHPEILSLAMLSLAIGDASAAIVGESLPSPAVYRLTSDKKSIEGSVTMFVTSTASIVCGTMVLDAAPNCSLLEIILISAVAAIIATAWEAISSKGFDNFTVPMSVAFVLSVFILPSPFQSAARFVPGVALSMLFVFLSYRARFLTADGSVAAFLLATCIFGLGGWKWAFPIVAFFILSSLLSKAGKRRKMKYQGEFEKTSTRDWGQVAANGGVAGIIMLAQYLLPDFDFFPVYVGSIAAATADTWGTEIGIWFHRTTYSLAKLRAVMPGTSGGVSFPGIAGGALGAAAISISASSWLNSPGIIWMLILAGVTGSLADSLLGGTLQASYRCARCKKETERPIHCETPTTFYQGVGWMNNDAVNWICTAMGALAVWAVS